jgi:D-alanine-D-alanine ligase
LLGLKKYCKKKIIIMKKNIAIIAGGYSSEKDVSLRSADGIFSFIDSEKYNKFIVSITQKTWQVEISQNENYPVDKNDFSFTDSKGKKTCFDFAYITIHGTPGENGLLQGYLDMLNIPYSTCGVLTAAITFDKFACNHYLQAFGIKISESLLLRQGQNITATDVERLIGFPCFVKPNAGGSSFGVTKVKTAEQLQTAIDNAFAECNEVMLEAFMRGTEVTCGMYETGHKKTVFPVTEVVSQNEFFDYDAKYNGQVSEITPARISDELTARIQQVTAAIYDILRCNGIIRVDYIISETGEIRLLEVNTTPGMTATSFIPQQVRAAGLDITQIMTEIIENK